MKWYKRKHKNSAILCNCSEQKAQEEFQIIGTLQGGSHTTFIMGKCKRCDGWYGFPNNNFLRTIVECTEETCKMLEETGVPVKQINELIEDYNEF